MKDPQIQHPLKDSYNNSDQQNSTDEESESSEVREAIQTRYDTSRRMEKKREQLEEREREASKSRIGCKTFILLVILVIVLLCAYISVQKPPQVLEPLKTRINDSYGSEIPVYEGGQEIAFEGTKLVLNEDQLYSFINGISETKVRIDRVELEQDTIIIMKNLATEGSPLWFAVEITNVSN
ncbi:hypothetical protein KC717_06910, partial [Candidatus Dojkabacteria bacterium]|nr:hypothetical protein [Candidatus Dojkabacteria bacterium]